MLRFILRRVAHRIPSPPVYSRWPAALAIFIPVLILLPHSFPAQTAAELNQTHKWVQSKLRDRRIMAALEANGIKPGSDPCNPENDSPGPYDPLPCIEEQRKGWKVLSDLAQSDPNASPTVQATIRKTIPELTALESKWRSLPQREKNDRLSLRKEILAAVKKFGGNVELSLQRIIEDSSRNQRTHETARGLLAACKQWRIDGQAGGPLISISWCILNCVCVQFENCPCCGYHQSFDSF